MYTLGIDIGSTTSKCALLKEGAQLVGTGLSVGGLGTEGPGEALAALWQSTGLSPDCVARTVATGYGRNNYDGADSQVSELTCHAMGGAFRIPGLRTVIDIGGQDAKVISLTPSGRMSSFVMNDKCAAGTGRFLDVMAAILRMDAAELEGCAARSTAPAAISSTCTVFAESEVISQLAAGVARPDLVAGICESVASRVAALARRVSLEAPVCMSGGVAKNGAVRQAMARILGMDILYDPLCQHFGAIGAALWGWRELKEPEGR